MSFATGVVENDIEKYLGKKNFIHI